MAPEPAWLPECVTSPQGSGSAVPWRCDTLPDFLTPQPTDLHRGHLHGGGTPGGVLPCTGTGAWIQTPGLFCHPHLSRVTTSSRLGGLIQPRTCFCGGPFHTLLKIPLGFLLSFLLGGSSVSLIRLRAPQGQSPRLIQANNFSPVLSAWLTGGAGTRHRQLCKHPGAGSGWL